MHTYLLHEVYSVYIYSSIIQHYLYMGAITLRGKV